MAPSMGSSLSWASCPAATLFVLLWSEYMELQPWKLLSHFLAGALNPTLTLKNLAF